MKCCKCISPTCSVVSIISCCIVCFIGGALKVVMPGFIEDTILGNFVLSKDSLFYDFWVEPPIAIHANFYVFNYTNYAEFCMGWKANGTKPRVEQLGPYVFRLSLKRSNITFFGNDEVQYIVNHDLEFVPEMSNGSVDDVIIFPNIILRAVVQHPAARTFSFMVTNILKSLNYSYFPFVRHTIGELLVDGFNDPILDKLKGANMDMFKSDKFKVKDYIFTKNLIRIKTGATNYSDFGQMVSFNNQTSLSAWPGKRCNEVKGAETSAFPPKLSIDKRLHLFIGELCRTIFFRFEKEVNHYGIKANRFRLDPDVMSNTNSEYECFCQSGKNKCWGAGVFNVGECKFDVPILLSLPHLFNTEYRIKNSIDGLAPDPEKHQFFMDLEKTTSMPVNVTIGLQVNIGVEPTPWLSQANNLPELILPVVFIHNSVDLNETTAGMLKSFIIDLPITISVTIPTVIWSIGFIIGLLGISCSVYLTFKTNKVAVQPTISPEKMFEKKFEY